MSMTDPVADMLTRIRNASQARHMETSMPASKLKAALATVLKAEGYIDGFRVEGEVPHKKLIVTLRYGSDRRGVITGIKRVSKPGLRVYSKAESIPRVMGGLGTAVLSTSRGLMTDRVARRDRVGGEILCYVW